MSGLINSAGSKSGVIGTTELDYEKGTFTPTGTALMDARGMYVRIGRLCHIHWYTRNNSTSTSRTSWGGLPFASIDTGGNTHGASGSQCTYASNIANCFGVVNKNATTVYFSDEDSALDMSAAYTELEFICTYEIG